MITLKLNREEQLLLLQALNGKSVTSKAAAKLFDKIHSARMLPELKDNEREALVRSFRLCASETVATHEVHGTVERIKLYGDDFKTLESAAKRFAK